MRIIIDLDHTICVPDGDADQAADPNHKYREAAPNQALIARLREYREKGFTIVVHTSRNMRTYEGDADKIREFTLPIILDWLERHEVPFDEVIVAKPWCGFEGFYVDDRALRPSEFTNLTLEEIQQLLDRERA